MSTAHKVTVVGAGYVGMTCAQRLCQLELCREVVLIDVKAGRAQGIALDLAQAAAIEGYGTRVIGTGDPARTAGSDLVIMTAGRPRAPGMSRSDLLEVNGRVVRSVAEYVRQGSPDAFVIVVTNPLDSMVQLMRQALGFPGKRVVGMAGVLDSARFSMFLAEAAKVGIADVDAMVLGAHGDSMVPVLDFCTVGGIPAKHLLPRSTLEALAGRTRNGGAEIVKLLETGSAFYAPACSWACPPCWGRAVSNASSSCRSIPKRASPCRRPPGRWPRTSTSCASWACTDPDRRRAPIAVFFSLPDEHPHRDRLLRPDRSPG